MAWAVERYSNQFDERWAVKVLVGRWEVELKRLLGKTQKQLMIISPFVTSAAVSILRSVAEGRSGRLQTHHTPEPQRL